MSSPSTNLPPDVADAARDPARRFGPDGRYILLEELGAGGMGRVWKGFDSRLGRTVAIKGLYRLDPESLARFRREAALTARLRHPGIVSVHDIGEHDGQPFLVMDFVDGVPLHKASLDLRAKAAALRDAARAVHFAHTQSVLHRDLKPSNLMMDAAGRTLVMDFGLAREVRAAEASRSGLTLSGDVLGTPAYMAPEQAQGRVREIDARSDVFGLGATLYHLLCGRPPHAGTTIYEVLRSAVEQEPRPSKVDPGLDKIALKAMEKDPARRYATAEALAEDLDRWLRGEPVAATAPGWTRRLRTRVRRNPWAWAGLAAAAALLLGGSALAAAQAIRHARQRQALLLYQDAQASFHAALLDLLAGGAGADDHMDAFEEKLAQARRLDPAFDRGWFERAQYWRLAGDESQAWRNLEAGLAREAENPLGRIERGMLAADQYRRDLDAARTRAWAEEAHHAREEGRPARPIHAEELEARSPSLGVLRRRAIEDLDAGSRTLDDATPPWVRLALAQLDYLQGHFEETLAKVRDVEFAAAKVLQGRVAEGRRDFALAEAWYDRAISTNSRWGEAYEARAHLLYQRAVESLIEFDELKLRRVIDDWTRVLNLHPARSHPRTERSAALRILGVAIEDRGGDPTDVYARAIDDAEAALSISPADRFALEARGNACVDLAAWQGDHGMDPTEGFRRGLESLQAARADPAADASTREDLGIALLQWGEWRLDRGEDPTSPLRQAVASLEEALAHAANEAIALNNLGVVHFLLGRWAADHGQDPSAEFDLADHLLGSALAVNPDHADAWSNRANLLLGRGQALAARGEDPSETYRLGIECADAALALRPGALTPTQNRGLLCVRLGEWQGLHGEDPTALYEQAVAGLQAALAANRQSATIQDGLALAYLRWGDWKGDRGEDPEPEYRRSIEAAEAALAANSNHAAAHRLLGSARLRLGKRAASVGEDPSPWYRGAVVAFEAAIAGNPADADSYLFAGTVHTWLGDRAAAQGEDPTAAYAKAIASFDAAIERNPGSPAAFANRGVAFHSLGLRQQRQGGDPSESFRLGIESLQRATELKPDDPQHFCNLGALYTAQAFWQERTGLDPADSRRRALAAYDRALEIYPDYWMAHYNRGVLFIEQSDWVQAAAALEAARRIAGSGHPAIDRALEQARRHLPPEY